MKAKSEYSWMLVLGCLLSFGAQGRTQTIFEEDFEGHSAGSWITSANDWRGVLNSGNIRISSAQGGLASRVANGFEAVGGLEQAVVREVDVSESGRYELTFDAYANLNSQSHEETHNVLMSFGRNTDQSAIRWGAEFTDEGGSLWKFGVHGHPNEIHPEIPFDQKIAFTIVMDTESLEAFGVARFEGEGGVEQVIQTQSYSITPQLVAEIDRLYMYQDYRRPATYVGVQIDNIRLARDLVRPSKKGLALLDEFFASSAIRGNVSNRVLESGKEYVLELTGTFSIWGASSWRRGICAGEAESDPMFGDAGGQVGWDPAFVFAAPDGSSLCQQSSELPASRVWQYLEGDEWLSLQPVPIQYSPNHQYLFRVIGKGRPISLSPTEVLVFNNYGDIRVRIFGSDIELPAVSSEILFAETYEAYSEGSWITSANDWRGVLNSGNIRISSAQGGLASRVANGFEAVGGLEQAVVREVDVSESGRYELTFDAYANLNSQSHEETHNVLMSFGRNTDQSAIRWGAEFTDEGGSLWKFGVHGHPNEIHPEIPFDQKIAFAIVMDTESLEAFGVARFEGEEGVEQVIQTQSYSITPQLVAEIDRLYMYQDYRRPGTYVGVQIDNLALTRVTKVDSPADVGPGREEEGAQFIPLGDLPGGSFSSVATSMSADGSVVVGIGSRTAETGGVAFVWTADTGLRDMFELTDSGKPRLSQEVNVRKVSSDGLTVVGDFLLDKNTRNNRGFRWRESTGLELIRNPDARYGLAVSGDGREVVTEVLTGGRAVPYVLTDGGWHEVMRSTKDIDIDRVQIRLNEGVSDLSVVAGWGGTWSPSRYWAVKAVRQSDSEWDFVELPNPSTRFSNSQASAVSADGLTLAGRAFESSLDSQVAVVWFRDGESREIGDLPGGKLRSDVSSVSGSGMVVGGYATADRGQVAFVWTESLGQVPFEELLTVQGVTLNGWQLESLNDMSADGQWFCGMGVNPDGNHEAWVAKLATPLDPDFRFEGEDPASKGEIASRESDRESVVVGDSLVITVRVNPAPDTLVYAVEEMVAEGLDVSDISDDGAFDVAARSLKWGPFFDDLPRELSYSLQLDNVVPGELRFSGTISISGTSFDVGGRQTLSVEGVQLVEPPSIAGLVVLDELMALTRSQRNLSNIVLEEGEPYVVELQGTYSVWSASTWNPGDCGGVSEGRPMFGTANGRVGFDPAYTFAIPIGASSCRDDLQLPRVRIWKYDTREGNRTFEPMPQPYSPEHRYRFSVIGEGAQLSFGTVDNFVSDNYGDIRVRVFGAAPTEPNPEPVIVGIRSLPETYLIGEPFEVVLEALPPTGTASYIVRERIGESLDLVSVSTGATFDESTREVRWGPFLDSKPRILSYQLVAAEGTPETLGFSGFVDLDGTEYETQGRETMQRGLLLSEQPAPGFGCAADGGMLTFLNSQGAVLDLDGSPAGADVWGQLYVGLTEDRLEPICEPRPVLALGFFSGGEQTVPGTSGGETVWVQLRAWRNADSFESAEIRGFSDLQQLSLKTPGDLLPAPVPATSSFQLAEVPMTAEFRPLVRVGETFILRWSGTGRLEDAPSVGGPFSDSVNQANPQEITIDPGVSRFFRIVRD